MATFANADDPRRKKLPDGPMAVECTKGGLYGRTREPGERFVLRNGRTDFSWNWMKAVTGRDADEVKEHAQDEGKEDKPADDSVL